jgi:hypothetical protein
MTTYVKPQTLVFQEFNLAPSEVVDPLRAHISGPNAMLHRFTEPAEKALINIGPYNRLENKFFPWPARTAGSLVDPGSVKLFVENALLLYFEDLIDDEAGGRGITTPVAGRKNWIKSDSVVFKSNGTSWPRSSLFGDRDVKVGDVVYIRGVGDDSDTCEEKELWTYVEGFASERVPATIFPVEADAANAISVLEDEVLEQIAGPDNCVNGTSTGTYNGMAAGLLTETYTITVVKSSISGCNAARLRITSASGTDNVDELTPSAFGAATPIGTRGAAVTFVLATGACVTASNSGGFPANEFIVGQTWELEVTQDFERVCAQTTGNYTGSNDDTYIVEVTKGGTWAQLPEVTITTTKGLDTSGPVRVTTANTYFPVGSYGLRMKFIDCADLPSSISVALQGDDDEFAGNSALAGLCKGDKFYVTVVSGQNGPIRTLVLRDDLPLELRTATDLDLRLFISKTIEVTENRLSAPSLVNYSIEATQIGVKAGITAYDSSWTVGGVEQPMALWGGRAQSATNPVATGIMYVEYREWLTALVDQVLFISDVANINDIPGPLDPRNPLKQGVYDALVNSNGTRVGYTAVADPYSLDSWIKVLERIQGRDDIYNLVPLTRDARVLQAYVGQVDAESSPEAGNWKAMVVSLQAKTVEMVVGQSAADAQILNPTSVNGQLVLATLEDDPEASDTQYTILSVPANNSGFITYGVRPGDIVRYLYTVDAHGDATYSEFVVDSVLSENTLRLLNGHTTAVSIPQKIEVWHSLNKSEIVADLQQQAQAFANRRVVATWPDVVGLGGVGRDGLFFAAAVAGLASGVVPHQGLTNVEIAGYDDLASRTKDFFTDSQLDTLASSGIWIGTEDRDGTPHTRHALTTSTLDLSRREEMVRRNLDSISYVFLRRLRPFIGRTNATPSMLRKLRYEVTRVIRFFKTNGYTADLGPQLIDGSIAIDREGQEILRIHPLAADRVEIVLNLVLPAPLNNVELHLVV